MKEDWSDWTFPHEKDGPYLHCGECKENYYKFGGHCKVADKYQRLPRDEYRGALGLCVKIGGSGS